MTSFLHQWIGLADRIATWAVRIAGAMMLAAAILVSFDVLLRKFASVTVGGADELSGYAFAVGTSWALAFTLLRRANVRVDALYARLPERLAAALDLLALLSLLVFVGYLTWRASLVLQDSLLFSARATTPLATPLWIPQTLWLAGFGLFLFTILPLIAAVAFALARGDRATVRRLAGARTLEEEAAEEKSHTAGLQPAGLQTLGGER
ncbi:TRAP transporter small permease subunit [Enterovirga aerilata]|uniref:TRAP transporter small permease protein n=1 Tax=Enterovirga aerilata TaxID=2730920 RepID=A0A849ICR5_9HYPH|nr:TRAP transporter small permease [Enterovirga sp. DB1703]